MSKNKLAFCKVKIVNIVTMFLFIVLALLISSCNLAPYQPKVINYHVGSKGMEISFLEQAPPNEVYENSSFNVNVIVENRGAYDVVEDKAGIISIGYDPFYMQLSEFEQTEQVQASANSLLVKGIQLYGKSQYHPTGDINYFSFSNFQSRSVMGQREKPSTKIFASLCYPYVTVFASQVCVDLSAIGENLRKQVCTQKDLSLTDQGAPVAITQIEVDNQPAGKAVVRPVYTIHIVNKGSGTVVSPSYDAAEFERVCSFQGLERGDFNTVKINAMLSESTQLECSPNPVRLFEGEGFTRCQVSDENLVIGHQNFETSLNINISYVYLTSVSKEIEIKRMNVYGQMDSQQQEGKCLSFEIEDGGECISKCDYCAKNKGGSFCQSANSKFPINYEMGGFKCACDASDCATLYPGGLCVPDSQLNLCPGAATFCCARKCTASEIRIKGQCYPPCARCSKVLKECACGSGTDQAGYQVTPVGKFCCTLTGQSQDDITSCKNICVTATSTTT